MSKWKDVVIIILFILIGCGLIGFVGYRAYNDFFQEKEEEKKLISIDMYGYTLSKRDTEVYKEDFKELEASLSVDDINYSDYAKIISKLFIIDLFTLNNKVSSTDIGGLEFIHKDLKENFKENMGATLYKNVESNLNGNRTQTLPIVTKVTVGDVSETKYTYGGTEYDAYIVSLTWEYQEDLGYQNSIKLTLIRDNKMLYIVKGE